MQIFISGTYQKQRSFINDQTFINVAIFFVQMHQNAHKLRLSSSLLALVLVLFLYLLVTTPSNKYIRFNELAAVYNKNVCFRTSSFDFQVNKCDFTRLRCFVFFSDWNSKRPAKVNRSMVNITNPKLPSN